MERLNACVMSKKECMFCSFYVNTIFTLYFKFDQNSHVNRVNEISKCLEQYVFPCSCKCPNTDKI